MRRQRPAPSEIPTYELCRGPGNLTMAMGITLEDNRRDLLGDRLFIEDRGLKVGPVAWGPRIGIKVGVANPWRAHVTGIPSVSPIKSSKD